MQDQAKTDGGPSPRLLRRSLGLSDHASETDVRRGLAKLPRDAACDDCRFLDPDPEHPGCSDYAVTWDYAEDVGIAEAKDVGSGWRWDIASGGES